MESELVGISARIEVCLDNPDFNDEDSVQAEIRPKLDAVVGGLDELLSTVAQGRLLANGIQVAVLGRPNVGKSSLFNAMLGRERAIVTDIAGTTTDVISEAIHYNGMRIVLNDTAGIRAYVCSRQRSSGASINEIEKLGIERTKQTVANADVVLAIFDSTVGEDAEVLRLCEGKPTVVVYNKCDLVAQSLRNGRQGASPTIFVSALTGENVEMVKQAIFELAVGGAPRGAKLVITNMRHAEELRGARETLADIRCDANLDMVARDVADAVAHLGRITGKSASDAVIDRIFSQFCIGK